MTKVFCEHHAQVPARWRCTQCHRNLCVQCAPRGPRDPVATCPTCREPLQSLGIGNTIKPFWQRIPRFFLYPAKLEPLTLAFALGILALAQMLPLIGLIVPIAIAVYTVRFSYRVLYHTALGNLEPPEHGQAGGMEGMFWKQVGLFVFLFGSVVFAAALLQSKALLAVGLVGALLLLPAAVITLAIDGSLASALNPLKLLFVATAIGWPYLLLWVMLLLLFGGEGQLLALLAPRLPGAALLFLSTFLSVYFSVAMFHMMGYVVYQYHERLGFNAQQEYSDSAEGARDLQRAAAAAPAVDRVQMLITDGRFGEAEQELVAQIEAAPDDLRLHDRYHRLMLSQDGTAERGAAHADGYIGKLVAQKQLDRALDVYRRSVERWPGFVVKDAADTVALARLAHQRNQPKLALPLLARFSQRFPNHAAIPEAALVSAHVLSTGMGKDQMALQIVEQLRRLHPQHRLRAEMDTLHATLTRLLARSSAAAGQPDASRPASSR